MQQAENTPYSLVRKNDHIVIDEQKYKQTSTLMLGFMFGATQEVPCLETKKA